MIDLFCNLKVLSVDLATSSGRYKCELNQFWSLFIVALQTIIWHHILKTCLANYENSSETGLISLQVTGVSFKSYTGYK